MSECKLATIQAHPSRQCMSADAHEYLHQMVRWCRSCGGCKLCPPPDNECDMLREHRVDSAPIDPKTLDAWLQDHLRFYHHVVEISEKTKAKVERLEAMITNNAQKHTKEIETCKAELHETGDELWRYQAIGDALLKESEDKARGLEMEVKCLKKTLSRCGLGLKRKMESNEKLSSRIYELERENRELKRRLIHAHI